jgi:4-amino-4-deoxychorismate lyase
MCHLFETLKISGGVTLNLSFHEERMNRSRHDLFGTCDTLHLAGYISEPPDSFDTVYRCRIIYGVSINSVEYSKYIPADIRTLKLVDAGSINYGYKYLDRSGLTSLIDKKVADDILIVQNGCITDASFANIVFTGNKEWVTPDTPLLRGTMREMLLQNGIIHSRRITIDSLSEFTHFRLVNAMLGFEGPLLPVDNIF